jgi:hypothetical protein
MFRLKRVLPGLVLVLSFLLGHEVAVKAQCQLCLQGGGPAGNLNGAIPESVCPCDPNEICWNFRCTCYSLNYYHAQCGNYPYCIGC